MNFEELSIKMKEKFKNHTKSTIQIRISCTKRLMRECFGVTIFDSYYYENIRDVKQYIYGFPNKTVRKNLSAGIFKALQAIDSDLIAVYGKFYQKMANEADSERIYKKPTKKELSHQKTWDEIVEIRKDLFKTRITSNNAFMRYFIAAIFTKIPPLRQSEWIGAAFVDTCNNNYVDLDKKILVLRNYKTQKQYGNRIINIPDSLITTMKKYKVRFKTNLLVSKVTDPNKSMSCPGVTSYLTNIFGCSVCMLRKIFISNMLDNPDITVERRKEVANIMSHKLSTQEFIYSTFSKKLNYE